jgi:hypothetical protein
MAAHRRCMRTSRAYTATARASCAGPACRGRTGLPVTQGAVLRNRNARAAWLDDDLHEVADRLDRLRAEVCGPNALAGCPPHKIRAERGRPRACRGSGDEGNRTPDPRLAEAFVHLRAAGPSRAVSPLSCRFASVDRWPAMIDNGCFRVSCGLSADLPDSNSRAFGQGPTSSADDPHLDAEVVCPALPAAVSGERGARQAPGERQADAVAEDEPRAVPVERGGESASRRPNGLTVSPSPSTAASTSSLGTACCAAFWSTSA